jgi:hypothetical protein
VVGFEGRLLRSTTALLVNLTGSAQYVPVSGNTTTGTA